MGSSGDPRSHDQLSTPGCVDAFVNRRGTAPGDAKKGATTSGSRQCEPRRSVGKRQYAGGVKPEEYEPVESDPEESIYDSEPECDPREFDSKESEYDPEEHNPDKSDPQGFKAEESEMQALMLCTI